MPKLGNSPRAPRRQASRWSTRRLPGLRPWGSEPAQDRAGAARAVEANARRVPGDAARSPKLIALPDGTVIAGNQRLAAAVALDWETIPCVYADLDEQTAIEWAFRDNNPVGETDDVVAAQLLAVLSGRGRPLDLTGFAAVELSALLRRVAPVADPDDAPPLPAAPRSERGVVYELGTHRLLCGDSTDAGDLAALMGEARGALLWTDPPYGVDYVGGTKNKLTIANDTAAGLRVLLAEAFTNATAALEERAAFYVAAPAGPAT